MKLGFAPVAADDFDALLALRIAAMRPSLEAMGRFDPQRARERFASQFEPAAMRWVLADGERIGLLTLRRDTDPWHLRHMYLAPGWEGRGIGTWVLEQAKREAAAAGCSIELEALRQSPANRFYQREGFRLVSEQELDLRYRWEPA